MSDVQPYSFPDPMAAQARGIAVTNALQGQQQQQQRQATLAAAGNALSAGDYSGGANTLYKSGDLQGGLQFDTIAKGQAAASGEADTAQKQALAKFTANTATRLLAFHQENANQPGADPGAVTQRTLAAFDQTIPQLKSMGETDDDIAQVRAHIAQDPQGTFTALGAGAAKELGYDVKEVNGQLVAIDKATGHAKLIASSSAAGAAPGGAPSAQAVSQDQANPDAAFLAPQSASPGITRAAATGGPADPDAVWAAIKHQESGGLASPGTAVGPDTAYGNALGSTQMLPATAEAMARKVGLPWNPALMRENSPQALAYQDKIGRAYFDEGTAANGGDPAAGAAYYFGGPNPALHGPKTAAYVQAVMARANPQPYQVASNGATPPPPGADPSVGTVDANGVLHLAPAERKWVPDGKGALINPTTGDTKKDDSFHGDDESALNDDAVHLLAGKYLNNGTLPPLGMGPIAAANRNKILNAATGMAKDLGLSADDLVAGTANVKALGSALTKAQGNWTAMSRQEEAAQANAGLMLSLAPKGGGQTNIPVVNRWLQAGRKQIAGDPDVTRFDSALGGYSEEFAKVMTGSAGSAAATDSARAAAAERLSRYATQGQLAAGVDTMNREMANQKNAASHVIVGITNQIHGGGRGAPDQATDVTPPPAATPTAPGQRLTPQQAAALPSGTHFIGQDGVERVRK